MRGYTFHLGKGTILDGKSHYPDALTIHMSRSQAFDVVEMLVHMLARDESEITISRCGELVESKNDAS